MRVYTLVVVLGAICLLGACAVSLDAEKLGLSAKTAKDGHPASGAVVGGEKLPPMVSVRGDRFLRHVVIV